MVLIQPDTTPCAPATAVSAKRISVLGSTGSVGANTVELLAANRHAFQTEALVANKDAEKLAMQARLLGAKIAVVADPSAYGALKQALSGSGIEAACGTGAAIEAASRPADMVMAAIVGVAGLKPTLAALRQGTAIALANKECLVSAGDLFMGEAAARGVDIVPVDSEHNAIFQALAGHDLSHLARIVLTASGGPFRACPHEKMASATPRDALLHPNWDMGAKISIDSATMMNKGLELIEAYHLFGIESERIGIVVHPESVIHGMVEFADGSVLAQMGAPDMRTPIAVSLAWPKRMAAPVQRLDLAKLGQLTFQEPDMHRFPALSLARSALEAGGGAPAVMNAANEIAVAAFLKGQIGFLDIVAVSEIAMERMAGEDMRAGADIEAVLEIDAYVRHICTEIIAQRRH